MTVRNFGRKWPVASLVVAIATAGCSRSSPVATNAANAVAANGNTQDTDTIGSWQKFSERVIQKAGQVLAASKAKDPANPWTVSVTSDLKKTDSVINPYVGVLTVVESFETPKLPSTWRVTYRVELVQNNGKWEVKSTELDRLDTTRGKPPMQTKKTLSTEEVYRKYLSEYLN